MAKEISKLEDVKKGVEERSKAWDMSLPLDALDTLNDATHVKHEPNVRHSWLPSWLQKSALEQGFLFDKPEKVVAPLTPQNVGEGEEEVVSPLTDESPPTDDDWLGAECPHPWDGNSVGVQVGRMWRRVMPNSMCWDIMIQCRCVAFDVATGRVAGAVYFDTRNMYIPCVGVDAAFRRRGLGSLLVVAAVSMCESTNNTAAAAANNGSLAGGVTGLAGARPNLCVSPKDLTVHPYLHAFYEALGFRGGRADRGGNYTLSVDDSNALLETKKGEKEMAAATATAQGEGS
jgi:GNAT superfamily N-acetyltransferase